MKIVNTLGKRGEELAARYLQEKGYYIIEFNFRKNYTEIDIIATKDETLVFIEVKTRYSDAYGTPFEAITKGKIKNLVKTANLYSAFHSKLPQSLRIDAIGVTIGEKGHVDNIEHVENITGF